MSRERLSIFRRQTDLVALRRLCCTPGGQELGETVRERDQDIPRQPVFMSSGERVRHFIRSLWITSSSNLERRKGGAERQGVMACFLHCANFTYGQTQMQRQRHVWGVPGVGVGGVMGYYWFIDCPHSWQASDEKGCSSSADPASDERLKETKEVRSPSQHSPPSTTHTHAPNGAL